MKPIEQQQLTIGSTVWCVTPSLTCLLETRVTEMRVFNINQDEPDEPIDEAIEYTLMGVGCELPHADKGRWFVYDGDMMTEYLGEQECYYTDKDTATLALTGLLLSLYTSLSMELILSEKKTKTK